MTAKVDRLLPGRPYPLGATPEIHGVNFAVFSAHAEKIELCLFDKAGRETARFDLPDYTDEVFHGFLPDGRPGQRYGFRAHGPYAPEQGHRFNPNKLLLDPYARELSGQLRWTDALYGYRRGARRGDLSFDRRDSASAMPKAVVPMPDTSWGDNVPPHIPWRDTVIYEAHVRGFSQLRDDIPKAQRGTFAALANPRMIDHLVKLGITAIELLPVHAFLQDRFLVDKNLRNYWGYSTLTYFAPEPRYLSSGGLNDIRLAVKRLHAAGIEVILDVVYNHTCESDEMGPTLSWRGLDNASYYRLRPGEERYAVNDTGTGNTLNVAHRRVLQMVLDSLRYWATSFHIDGFRFDLGSTLGREAHGFDPDAGFFDALLQDPVLSRLKLISEPWDLGPGGYQLGNHPPGFAEWNDRFRDGVRQYVRGDRDKRGEVAARLAGSGDIFARQGRKTWASVNFVTAHDGFTLQDVTSYIDRHNDINGEDNRDGAGENYASNGGVEGPSDDSAVNAHRERIKRLLLSLLFFAHGTPMLLAGDELGRTQNGNNNAYCQDNEISWVDWKAALQDTAQTHLRFTRRLIAARRDWPALRGGNFMHGTVEPAPGVRDIAWFDEQGRELTPPDWRNADAQLLVLRRAALHAEGPRSPVGVTLLLMNATGDDREFTLPPPNLSWRLLTDSADPDRGAGAVHTSAVTVGHHAAVLLTALLEAGS